MRSQINNEIQKHKGEGITVLCYPENHAKFFWEQGHIKSTIEIGNAFEPSIGEDIRPQTLATLPELD